MLSEPALHLSVKQPPMVVELFFCAASSAAPVPGPGLEVRGMQEAGGFPQVYHTAKGVIQLIATHLAAL